MKRGRLKLARAKFIDPEHRKPATSRACCACKLDIRVGQRYRLVHLLDHGAYVLYPEDEAAFATVPRVTTDLGEIPRKIKDLGEARLCQGCAEAIGLEWSRPVKPEAPSSV